MKNCFTIIFAIAFLQLPGVQAQTNIVASPLAEAIMLGNYNPSDYAASPALNHPDTISRGIHARVSPDSLHHYMDVLGSFYNRNSGSDTLSTTKGIGAARRWIYSKFEAFSAQNGNRLIPSYLQFDRNICNITQHSNVFAVLPGTDTSAKGIIIIEAHMDSRCEGLCDTACLAAGIEDNATGTALVMELARVMSRYSYKHTLVFLATTAEEQGLYGAKAFADYAKQKGIEVKAVLNNDVTGGIICGKTASPPGCPGENEIDSTQVRLFSQGSFNSPHKGLVRYIKLQYRERILPFAAVPMTVTIMSAEDRTGRSGDHIPFRQNGYTAMRFTSAHEHGDAHVTQPGYDDRQHTSGDILGVDTDHDSVIDSFFVDFNYLARNTVINGNAAGMIAISPETPDFDLAKDHDENLVVTLTDPHQYLHYRIGVRTETNDWDSVYTFTGSPVHTLTLAPGKNYIVSVAAVNGQGVESLFSGEQMTRITAVYDLDATPKSVELLQNRPNPFDEATTISVLVHDEPAAHKNAFIVVRDIASGKEIKRMPIRLSKGVNEILYEHGYHMSGAMVYTLVIDGKVIDSKTMVFAN